MSAVAGPDGGSGDRRIHDYDQRNSVTFEHQALRRPLHLEQRGATHPQFVAGTSSVGWPVAEWFARYLCDNRGLVQGRCIAELGAGIGLVSAVVAALGAKYVIATDWAGAMPLLTCNRETLAKDDISLDVAELDWGNEDHHGVVSSRCPDGFDLVIASDVIVPGFHTDKLLASCVALTARHQHARVLIAYEFREEWETIGTFLGWAEEAGFECSHQRLRSTSCPGEGDSAGGEDSDDEDCTMLLYTLRWRDLQPGRSATEPPGSVEPPGSAAESPGSAAETAG